MTKNIPYSQTSLIETQKNSQNLSGLTKNGLNVKPDLGNHLEPVQVNFEPKFMIEIK